MALRPILGIRCGLSRSRPAKTSGCATRVSYRQKKRSRSFHRTAAERRYARGAVRAGLPVLSVKHDSQVKGRCRYCVPPSTAPLNKGVACPLIKTATPYCQTLWAMFGLLPQRSFTSQSIGNERVYNLPESNVARLYRERCDPGLCGNFDMN